MNLNGKTAIVTGASRGIGAAVAEQLASLGANVAVVYAGSAERAEAVCARCRELGSAAAKAYQCDVADFDAVKQTVAAVKAASISDLEEVKGISHAKAEMLYNALRNGI